MSGRLLPALAAVAHLAGVLILIGLLAATLYVAAEWAGDFWAAVDGLFR